jgi:hypothetical protein
MASTFSSLKFELIGTGEQDGTWGNTTNTNLGTAIEQAITGSGDITFTSADVTISLTNSNSAQPARNLRLVLVGTSGGARQLIVPAIEKQYIIKNELADTVTVKNTSGTGIAVPSGKTMFVFNDGTNVVDVTTYASSLTLGSALPVASGGTGVSTLTGLAFGNGTSAFSAANAAQVVAVIGGTPVANASNAVNLITTNFTIQESGGKLVFKYGANVIASIDSTGNLTSATNITAYGTP